MMTDADVDATASDLIRWMEIPGQPNVFALGNFARQVTFASQQTRAFNLIWALFRTNQLAAGQRVAVVGAGLGGLTAVVAALAKECSVDLFEHASQPCPLQRGNDIRFIHPNILRWPESDSQKASTDFPDLNWTAANVRGVIKQIDHQWNMLASKSNFRLRKYFNYRVNRLYAARPRSGPQKPWLSANRVVDGVAVGDDSKDGATPGYVEFDYDCVILAVGFGEERSVAGVPFLSYWENDSLHQETGRGQRSVLVSGCGDGGLIDALRLRVQNFDHAEFVRVFQSIGSDQLIRELQKIESDLRPQASSPDISLQLQARYDLLKVPPKVEEFFRRRKRTDTTVTLNSPAPGPLNFRASLLNRYATYLAMRYADLHYLSGRVVAESSDASGFLIAFERDDIGIRDSRRFDSVIVRHGPENVIRRFVPEAAISEMQTWWETREDITIKTHWTHDDNGTPHGFFRGFQYEAVASSKLVLDLALANFDAAYRDFRRDQDVQSVAVGEHEGKASFIVTLKAGSAQRQPTQYAGVLVQYLISPAVPVSPTSPQTSTMQRRLPIGVGIYNYDVQQSDRDGTPTADLDPVTDPYSSSIGTLGCFARDKGGKTYLLTASFVLALDKEGQIGHKIFVEGESPERGNKPIATISNVSYLPTTENTSELGFTGIASAVLEPDVVPDFEPLTSFWSIKGVGSATVGNQVAKVGRTSGLTTGTVADIDVRLMDFTKSGKLLELRNCIQVKSETDSDFALPGDNGAAIVRNDGTVVGLIIGRMWGSNDRSQSAIAGPIEHALTELHLDLLASDMTIAPVVKPERKSTKVRRSRAKSPRKS